MTALPPIQTGRPRAARGHLAPTDGLDIPYAIIEGAAPGPTLLVTAGIHGSEYCSIEAAVRLMRTPPESIRGRLLILPIVSGEAFRQRSIYVMPQDGKNLNRQFPGDPEGTASQKLAHWLVSEVYPKADAYLDLHGGDLDEALAPFSVFPSFSDESRALAIAFALPTAVAAGGEGYTINAAGRIGVPSIIAEVSGNGLWSEATVKQLTDGVARVMRHLGMTDFAPPAPQAELEYVTMWVPNASTSGLWYSKKELSEPVRVGEIIGEIRDVFGETLAAVASAKDGRILYRLTSLSVNQGEALLGVGTPMV